MTAAGPGREGASAGVVSRAIAFFIDAMLLIFSLGAVHLVVEGMDRVLRGVLPRWTPATLFYLGIPLWVGLYFVICWYLMGQTLGMWLLGLRVVSARGGVLSFGQALLRLFGAVLSIIPLGLGFIWIAFDRQHRAWHDRLARTSVVYTWPAPEPAAHPLETLLARRRERQT